MSGIANKLMSAAGGGDVGAWDLSYAYYDDPLAWDISTSRLAKSFSVAAQEANPQAVFFKPDGTKMYVMGFTGDDVNEYDLSTAWDVSTAVFLQLFSVAAQETTPNGLFFKPDGTKMYITGGGADVNEYDLSTAWDVSTAVFFQLFSVAAQDTGPSGLFFKPDGTKMYVVGAAGDDVNEYDLSTAWNVSTAVFLQLFSVAAEEASPRDISFKPDGTKMYIIGDTGDEINEYDLSTAWDISTAVFLQNFSVVAQDDRPTGLFFKPDGLAMYFVGSDIVKGDIVHQYTLGGFSVAAQETSPEGLFFKPDGTKMYLIGSAGDDVNEYNLGTAWDLSTASFLQNFSVAAQETSPVAVFFKPDGTKMYITGNSDNVYEYNLSTAWNVSTASYLQLFSVAAQENSPEGLFFKPDGTKMYVIGITGDDVNEYNLGTAWDVSSASYSQSFLVSSQASAPRDIYFRDDGIKMFVIGSTTDSVFEYDLSTAWNVSTASYLQNFSVAAQEGNPFGVFFKPDGTQMFVVGISARAVLSYTLGVQP